MPNPQQRLWGAARTISCSPIVPRTPASPQESEESQAQSPKQLSLFPDKPAADISKQPCPSCNSYQVRESAGLACHHKSLVCANCSRWLKWLSKPKEVLG